MDNIKTRTEFSIFLQQHLQESWSNIVEQKKFLDTQRKEAAQ